jgi:hypothetical protein
MKTPPRNARLVRCAEFSERSARDVARAFRVFAQQTEPERRETLQQLWTSVLELKQPFLLDADADMAKFTFLNGRSFHLCTSTRRFHRPKRTGKPQSITIVLSGFKGDYDDPENQLIPCDAAGTISCCYFGMAVDEAELALYYIKQLIGLSPARTSVPPIRKRRIVPRHRRR